MELPETADPCPTMLSNPSITLRPRRRLHRHLSLALVLLATACVAPRQTDADSTSALQPVPATAPHAEALPSAQAPQPNRDLHGPADTADYIARLQSAERVKELKPELVAHKLQSTLNLSASAVIADVGCGPGLFAVPFARIVPNGYVLCVDVEPAQLDAVRARIHDEKLDNVVPVLASYDSPHLPPNTCDLIFLADTYHHIEARVDYFAGLREGLTPTGVLVLLEYKEGDLPVGPPADHKVPVATRHQELTKAGFELRESLNTHMWQDLEIWQRKRIYR